MSRAFKRVTRIDPAFLVVDKPAGMTSHTVVSHVRRLVGERRVGHSGTLDPDATGVLVLGIGVANRLFDRFPDVKSYDATIRFGSTTTTLDAAGDTTATFDMSPTLEQIDGALPAFIGHVNQVPPMVSALKVDGKRLHALARQGIEVERAPRPVRIDQISLHSLRAGPPAEADISVDCGGGTYIRSLAADLGTALGGGAHLARLRRTRVGAFTLEHAETLEQIEANPSPVLLSLEDAFGWPVMDIESGEATLLKWVGNGASIDPVAVSWEADRPVVVRIDGRVAAVYEYQETTWRPVVVVPKRPD